VFSGSITTFITEAASTSETSAKFFERNNPEYSLLQKNAYSWQEPNIRSSKP
jgi:hypothetical protein